jgi:predicted RNase H-like nuclease
MNARIAGIDGCPKGWIVAIAPTDDLADVHVRVFAHFADILEHGQFSRIAVDMPIGLPERAGPGGRGAERAVRHLLGKRRSSVFSVPARCAVYALDYDTACKEALEHSDPARKISKQSFAIFPKIRELDGLLRDKPDLVDIVHEVHPEVAFWRLNGEKPLTTPKKMNGRPYPPGLDERRKLLVSAGISQSIVSAKSPRGAAIDDMLDALAGLVIAKRLVDDIAQPFPNPPMRDAYGLPIAIWA